MTTVITEPGAYELDEHIYHADPVPSGSLSSTGARHILAPSCPALYRYETDNPRPPKREFDLGHVVHTMVLGTGAEIEVIDADNYQTKKAQQQRDAAYDRGAVPVLPAEFDAAQAMAAAVRRHPRYEELFDPFGAAEQSMFWIDEDTGVWCRGRTDWLAIDITDLKTTTDVSDDHLRKEIHNHGYHQQADFYLRGARALDLVDVDAAYLLVFVSKTAPYLVRAFELDETSLKIGHDRNQLALETYRDCKAANVWPGYDDDIELIGLPSWAERSHYQEI